MVCLVDNLKTRLNLKIRLTHPLRWGVDSYRDVCYLIHFDEPFNGGGNQHYIGFAPSLPERIAKHRASKGSAVTARANQMGISWRVVRVWSDADSQSEKMLKKLGGVNLCPVCSKYFPRTGKSSQVQGPPSITHI